MTTRLDNRQSRQRSQLDQLSTSTDLRLDSIMDLVNTELTMPLRMRATTPTANRTLNIDAVKVSTTATGGHTRNRVLPPINNTVIDFTGGNLTFPATSGGSITGSVTFLSAYTLTITSGQYRKVLVMIDSSNKIVLAFGAEGASESAATVPAQTGGTFAIGYVTLQNVAGTISNVINSRIYQFVGGGGGGGAGGAKQFISQAAHGLAVKDVIYNPGSGYVKAQANSASTLGMFIVSQVFDANSFELTQVGYIDGLSGLTAGQYYYCSDTTPGLLTVTEPVWPNYSNPIFFAVSAVAGYVLPFRPSINMAPQYASASQDGIVSNAAQTFGGAKTFADSVTAEEGVVTLNTQSVSGTISVATGSTLWAGKLVVPGGVTYSVSGDLVTAGAISGTGSITGTGTVTSV